jgi:hypothetical protein
MGAFAHPAQNLTPLIAAIGETHLTAGLQALAPAGR